ncbi:MAG TPA: hypothetical protein VF635_05095, partial [Propionibacteriaceae bacterium]
MHNKIAVTTLQSKSVCNPSACLLPKGMRPDLTLDHLRWKHEAMTAVNDSGPPVRTVEAAQAQFDAEVTYLNTATLGLPPRCGWDALQEALTAWRAGTANPLTYDAQLARARASYARLVGVDPGGVAVGSQVSVIAGIVAASLPDGSEVLTASGDFTSILFPFYAQARRGVTVREVPLE